MVTRNFGFTFGRTPEGRDSDYNALLKRLEEQNAPNVPDTIPNTSPVVTPDDNPVQITPTKGWLYVPSVGLEFAQALDGLGSNWYDAHKLVKSKNLIMPSPEETWALFFEAKANLAKPEFRKIYEYFIKKTPQNTWHGEWQDAFFKKENKKMFMHRLKSFNTKGDPEFHKGTDITGTYQTTDGYSDISNRTKINSSGLCNTSDPRTNYVEGENMYFWYPRNGQVAWFDADSDRAVFYCGWYPTDSYSSLGVRFARRVAPSMRQKTGGSK